MTVNSDYGTAFVHINMAKDAETLQKLNDVAEFNAFRMALKQISPVKGPQSIDLSLVDAGSTID